LNNKGIYDLWMCILLVVYLIMLEYTVEMYYKIYLRRC